MKQGIHPDYKPATIVCSCGNRIETRSTQEEIHVEICAVCHPFYTGRQKLVDTAGRVERFKRKYGDVTPEEAGSDEEAASDDEAAPEEDAAAEADAPAEAAGEEESPEEPAAEAEASAEEPTGSGAEAEEAEEKEPSEA